MAEPCKRRGKQVIVWLGAPDPSILEVLRFLSHADLVGSTSRSMTRDKRLFENEICEAYGVLKKPYRQFLEHPYWSRVWIIQEYVLAQHLTLGCGFIKVNSETLERFAGHLEATMRDLKERRKPDNDSSARNFIGVVQQRQNTPVQ